MGFKIAKVERGGLADELGLRKGDELLEINGEKLIDLIDYQQLMSCCGKREAARIDLSNFAMRTSAPPHADRKRRDPNRYNSQFYGYD